MSELGTVLRSRREELGLTLAQVEIATHIRQKYLVALEEGNFAVFPDPVHARGFLRNYAHHLGLDPQELLEHFDTELPKYETLKLTQEPSFELGPLDFDLSIKEHRRSWQHVSFWLALLALVIIFGGGFWLTQTGRFSLTLPPIWRQLPFVSTETPTVTPTWTLLPTHIPAPTATPAPPTATKVVPQATPTAPATATPTPKAKTVQLHVIATGTTWLRAIVNGQTTEEITLQSGDERTWEGRSVELRLGNAGGVKLLINGQDQGVLGAEGEVVDFVWEFHGQKLVRSTPTPTPVPTP